MAIEGDTKLKYGRQYTFINPDASIGPSTWRLSTIDEIAQSGGTSGGITDIDGLSPIVSTPINAQEFDISIDISSLPEKP